MIATPFPVPDLRSYREGHARRKGREAVRTARDAVLGFPSPT